jgi:hypothetical protein
VTVAVTDQHYARFCHALHNWKWLMIAAFCSHHEALPLYLRTAEAPPALANRPRAMRYNSGMGTCSSTSERLQKLLRYALDPSAGSGEAENAAARAISHARLAGMDLVALARALGGAVDQGGETPPQSSPEQEQTCGSPPDDIRLAFGRHRGRTLGEIYRIDRQYLRWIRSTVTFDYALRRACEEVLNGFRQSRAA